jgi:hypothetical protein
MKTKTFLLLFLFLGIGLTQLFAQDSPLPKNGETGSVSDRFVWDGYYIPIPVYCGSEEVDMLIGKVDYHWVGHFQNGEHPWCHDQFFGEVISSKTGEVFTVKDIFKTDNFTGIGTGHINLKGSEGSHYILTYIYNGFTDSYTFPKAVCN